MGSFENGQIACGVCDHSTERRTGSVYADFIAPVHEFEGNIGESPSAQGHLGSVFFDRFCLQPELASNLSAQLGTELVEIGVGPIHLYPPLLLVFRCEGTEMKAEGSTRRTSLLGRLSAGHFIMLLAGLLAVLANFAVLRARDESFLVAVADRDLGRGTVATADAFRVVEVQVDSDLLVTLVEAENLAELGGRIAARSIADGELILASDFVAAAAPSERRAMSIPVARVHAAGGMITDADVVDVVAVVDGIAEYIVVAAPVLDVAAPSTTGIGSSGEFYVTVAVDATTALRIAGAMDRGSIEIVRSTGASRPIEMIFPPPSNDLGDETSTSEPDAGT